MRRWLLGAALVAGLAVPTLAQADQQSDQIAHGMYVTRAADCQACHTAPGGQAFAGGRAFVLPFGVLYSPNITPDPLTGIAGYSDDDWVRMIQQGIGRGGKRLYPAMPYPSYTGMSRDDALAIKTYLMSLPPVQAQVPPNQIKFPFNQRWGMVFWNIVNNSNQRFQPDPAQSAAYNRGAYLVEDLGHCGECHTPRNFMMGLSSRKFAGAAQEGWLAYNLTSDKTSGIGGWGDAALTQYLSTGFAPGHGPASGPMAEAVQDSLQYLTPQDIGDIVLYLRKVPARPDGPAAVDGNGAPLVTADALGPRLFAQACEGCHLTNGGGRQWAWAALKGSQTAGDPAGLNIVQVLSQGSQIETAQGTMFMHPFTGAYTADELAALANYTISQFGYRQGNVTAQQFRDASQPTAGKPSS